VAAADRPRPPSLGEAIDTHVEKYMPNQFASEYGCCATVGKSRHPDLVPGSAVEDPMIEHCSSADPGAGIAGKSW
jgi:hypothetical protein